MILSIRSILVLVTVLLLFVACKKEKPIFHENHQSVLKSQTGVTYNSTHDILIFPTFQSVTDLANKIQATADNYPYDRGNTDEILAILDDIRTYGYTNGNGNGNGNDDNVVVNNFLSLLINSHPLSETVLLELIEVNNEITSGLPNPFFRDVFVNNAPFSYQVRTALSNAQVPVGIKNQILASDDNQTLDRNYAFEDFLAQFPDFNSLWSKSRLDKLNKLESGMSPGDPQFESEELLTMGIEQLFFNDKYEIYIEGKLYKIYNDCKMAVSQAELTDAYAELAFFGEDGFYETPELPETQAGIPVEQMATVFPQNTAIVNPVIYNPETNPGEAYNSAQLIECPQSAFNYIAVFDGEGNLAVAFENFTSLTYPQPTFCYWNFGDGTGSFQFNPEHFYANNGAYTVTLTTFSEDCGCWDVVKQRIEIVNTGKPPLQHCDASFTYFPEAPGSSTYIFSVHASSYTVPFAPIQTVDWDFGDGTTATGITVSHTFDSFDDVNVTMTVTFEDVEELPGCVAVRDLQIPEPGQIGNCQRRDKDKFKHEEIFGGAYGITCRGKYNGLSFLGVFGGRIKSSTDFYKKKNNGNWKLQKAEEIACAYFGIINEVDESGLCTTSEPADGSKVKNNESGVTKWSDVLGGGQGFGTEDGALTTTHQVKFEGQLSPIFTITL